MLSNGQFGYTAAMREIVLIIHNVRSSHNVGSLLRTADGIGVKKVYITGYTPYPAVANDTRLPHIVRKVHQQISKTALGAETSAAWQHTDNIQEVIMRLRSKEYQVIAVEQHQNAEPLPDFKPPKRIALIVGREVEGIEAEVLKVVDGVVEIPMFGGKESFNVVQAAAMALYHCRFSSL